MLAGNFLQSSYALINTYWVGNYIDINAVGATTVTGPIQFLMLAIAIGATIATSILVAQTFGAKNYEAMGKVIGNSFSLALILGIILTAVGLIFGDNLLHALNVNPDQFEAASSYFKLMMIAFLPSFFSLLIAAILRGIGDTFTPLAFMAGAVLINAILDPFLIIGIGPFPRLGTNGAAVASIIAQIIGLSIALIYLHRKNHFVAVKLSKFSFDKVTALKIIRMGLPTMVQQSAVSIGAAVIFTVVNSFGEAATNAYGGCGRLEQFIFLPAISFGMAATALTGQNFGAKKPERIKQVYKWAAIFSATVTLTLSLVLIIFSSSILRAFGFGTDTKSLEIGLDYIHIVAPTYMFFGLLMVSNGVLNGSGNTFITMIFALGSAVILRVPLSLLFAFGFKLGTHGAWLAIAMSFIVMSIVSFIVYKSGVWKKKLLEPNLL